MIVIIAAIIIITNTDDFRNLQCGLKIVAKTKSDTNCNGNENLYCKLTSIATFDIVFS